MLCRLLILVRPEMRGAVRDAIDRYGWDLKHQHVAVALEFEAQVMEAVGALLSRAQLLQHRAHGGMASKVQDVDDVPRWAGEDADVNAIYESWKENNAGG